MDEHIDGKINLIEEWHEAFESVEPYIVKIITPQGTGTGFMIACTGNHEFQGIATAAHVLEVANYWRQPIRIQHVLSGETIFLDNDKRSVRIYPDKDIATIIIKGNLPLPKSRLNIIQENKRLKVGVEIGWMGFPAIAQDNLCFFSGRVSSWVDSERFYFVDGVAINGVSGGPAFSKTGKEVYLIGLVSAYIPNRATGIVLPGLCLVRDIFPIYETIEKLKSFEEAKSKEKQPESAPPPSPSPSPSPST